MQRKRISLKEINTQLREHKTLISTQTSWLKFVALKYHVKKPIDKKLREVSDRHKRNNIHNILIGLRQNPNEIITNVTGDAITAENGSILYGLDLSTDLPLDLKNRMSSLLQNLYGTNWNAKTYLLKAT